MNKTIIWVLVAIALVAIAVFGTWFYKDWKKKTDMLLTYDGRKFTDKDGNEYSVSPYADVPQQN